MASRKNSSEDDWSLVSDDEGVLSDVSYDEVEAEPEMIPATCNTTSALLKDEESQAVLDLLPTCTSERSFEGYSREVRVSLLSSAHSSGLHRHRPTLHLYTM